MSDLDFFKQFLYEAPGDDPPDIDAPEPAGGDPPPDIGGDDAPADAGPPDLDDGGDAGTDDAPPDLGDDGGFDAGGDDFGGDDGDGENPEEEMMLDDKISAIMNMHLYQRFLELLSTLNNQISSVKNNADVLYSVAPDSTEYQQQLTKLDDNIHAYLDHYFTRNDYSKNLLFFNKCLNLLALLNQSFDDAVKKGIKSMGDA